MHDLAPLNAMASGQSSSDTIGSVTLRENANLALASVAARLGQAAACEKALKKLLGAPLPGPGKAVLNDPVSVFWMGPDQWMLWAPYDSHEDLAKQAKSATAAAASITEQSDGWVCFDLTGAALADVMERLCILNVRAMQKGDATRTVIDHLGCLVVRTDGLRIIGPRSSAQSLHHAIVTAMTSVSA